MPSATPAVTPNIKENNPDIEINAGIESDFSYDEEFKEKEIEILRSYPFDYVIGSVHGMEKANYIDYLQANIDMIKTYPINIIGHLKLRKEYEQYKEKIEEIVEKIIEDKLNLNKNYIFTATAKYRILAKRLQRVITISMKYIVQSIKQSEFEVFGHEIEFGKSIIRSFARRLVAWRL